MIIKTEGWKKLLLFAGGLALGTAFCMKWMEKDFLSQGRMFTIIGLEAVYPPEKLGDILGHISEPVRQALLYHLYFDFAFMAAVYPGIAALCMLAARRCTGSRWVPVFRCLAFAQAAAWACDIAENIYLLRWTHSPERISGVPVFHLIVGVKWGLALLGLLMAIPVLLLKRTRPSLSV